MHKTRTATYKIEKIPVDQITYSDSEHEAKPAPEKGAGSSGLVVPDNQMTNYNPPITESPLSPRVSQESVNVTILARLTSTAYTGRQTTIST